MDGPIKRLLALAGGALIAAGLSLSFASPALADPDATSQPAKGVGIRNTGVVITLPFQDRDRKIPRYQLKFDNGDVADIYCIDLGTDFGHDKSYAEGKWADAGTGNNTAKQNLPEIKWILLHSTPNVSLADIEALPGFPADHGATDERLGHLARVATQAAIWSLSDGAALAGSWRATDANGVTEKEFKVVKFLYGYLTGSANMGAGDEPPPSLKITPATASGAVGGKAGPFEIDADAPKLDVTAEGGKIVDADGNASTKFEDGTKFWLTSDKAGEVVVKATGSAKLRVGRVFLYDGDKGRYQKMILAGAARQDVSAQVKASFTPGLPQTGDNVMTYVASGTGIAALGAVVFMLARRRLVRLRRLAS